MAERIEILRGEFRAAPAMGNPAAINNYGSFVSNNAVASVNIDTATAPTWFYVFTNANGNPGFQQRDNVIILSIAFLLPYHYVFANGPLSLYWVRSLNAGIGPAQPLETFSTPYGRMYHPTPNTEYAINTYVPWPDSTLTEYTIGMQISAGSTAAISMIGADALLNGTRFYPTPIIKVLHTLAMI